jgi:polysaccharide pyruvyl transferase WcaK-like protein
MNAQTVESIKIPIVLYGIGYIRNFGDGELTDEQKESIRLLNARVKLTSVRDDFTFRFLRELGINDVQVIGDPAIFLGSQEADQLDLNDGKLKIGMNVACHFWTGYPQYLHRAIREYTKAGEFLIKRMDVEIVYLMHHPDEKLALELMKKKLPVKIANTGFNPYKMKHIYGNLDLVIGMMMHSAVLAFGSGVPMLNIAYDVKNYNFMEFIGQKDKVIDVRGIDSKEICELAVRVLESSKEIKKSFELLRCKLFEKQKDFITKIEDVIYLSQL